VTLCERAPRLPASPSLFTFQFHSLVVSLSDFQTGTCFHVVHARHLALKGLRGPLPCNSYFILYIYLAFQEE